jgi:hypothetical protein
MRWRHLTEDTRMSNGPKIIEETRQYIRDFDRLAGTTTTARELYDKIGVPEALPLSRDVTAELRLGDNP